MNEHGAVQRLRATVAAMFPQRPPHLVVAFSGGRDSLALLLLLDALHRLDRCRLTVAHVDHRLRPDSADHAVAAREVAATLGHDLVTVTATDHPVALYPGVGVEEAARRVRYEALLGVVESVGSDAIATGHHRQDQAETVLLHLLRGSGLAGLAGMAADRVLRVPWWGGFEGRALRVVRPLLGESPETLDAVARASTLPVIEDDSNVDAAYRRNRVRHDALPLLEAIAPGVAGRLASLAEIAREDDAALEAVAEGALVEASDGGSLRVDALLELPVAIRRRVLRRWIGEARGLDDLSRERVDAVMRVVERAPSGQASVEIGGGWRVLRDATTLRLEGPLYGGRGEVDPSPVDG